MKQDSYVYRNERRDVNLSFEFDARDAEVRRKKEDFLALLREAVKDLEAELKPERAN